ncbi:MAG: acetylxylan esterase [Planctomycetes bacterium]|nr:acetylxylan esterase [Planctomycetota bacterium]
MNRRDVMKALGLATTGCLLGAGTANSEPARQGPPSTHDLFEAYYRRFAEARLRMPRRDPVRAEDRQAIVRAVGDCLGIRDGWVPTIRTESVREVAFEGGRVELLRSTSWPGVSGTALLYRPDKAPPGPLPLVVLCCGHGKGGKLAAGYQRMARHVCRRGAMVLCPDNLGQGEREPMGHRKCVKPFACGSSVQGLIVMETLGWVAWARAQSQVDPKRLAAIGNSGGGTLTVFLAALCPELAVLSSSGYPGTFEFVAAKEKRHCYCNVLPGVLGEVEMWHLLGCFAPRPMFIFQGALDVLFPQDLFYQVARQVRHVYRSHGAEEQLRAKILPGEHSWDAGRNRALGDFLARHLGLEGAAPHEDANERLLGKDDRCHLTWPEDALTTDALAEQLTGRRVDNALRLWDVFPPRIPDPTALEDITGRGATREIFAQFEAFLRPIHSTRTATKGPS